MDKLTQAVKLVHEYAKKYPYSGWVVLIATITVWWLV